MRVLLVAPPAADRFYDFVKLPPLGIAYIAAALRGAGHRVGILDATLERRPAAAFDAAVTGLAPDAVGFSASTATYEQALALAGRLRRARPQATTVFGGVHPTWMPAAVAADAAVDYAVFGEGEETVVELFAALEAGRKPAGVRGVAFRDDGRVAVNPPRPPASDLDALPRPAYDLLAVRSYATPQASRLPLMSMITSRGCPYSCIFCDAHLVFGRGYRFHSPRRTYEELELLRERFGVREIAFKDSEFTLDLARVEALCDLLLARPLGLKWTCNGRVGRLSRALLGKMRRAGCRLVWFGVESGDPAILEALRKGITPEEARETFRLARACGIRCGANFLVGCPGETAASLEATLRLARELRPDFVNFSRLAAYPGTALFAMAKERGWLRGGTEAALAAPERAMNASAMSDPELERAHRRLYRRFYLRPGLLARRALVTTPHGWLTNARGLWKVLKG